MFFAIVGILEEWMRKKKCLIIHGVWVYGLWSLIHFSIRREFAQFQNNATVLRGVKWREIDERNGFFMSKIKGKC